MDVWSWIWVWGVRWMHCFREMQGEGGVLWMGLDVVWMGSDGGVLWMRR